MFKVLSSMEYPEFLRVRCKVKGFGLDCVTVSQPMDYTEVLRVVLPCKG